MGLHKTSVNPADQLSTAPLQTSNKSCYLVTTAIRQTDLN